MPVLRRWSKPSTACSGFDTRRRFLLLVTQETHQPPPNAESGRSPPEDAACPKRQHGEPSPMTPTAEQKDAFAEQGFFITEPLYEAAALDEIAAEFERIRAAEDAAMGAEGSRGITHRGRR